MKKIINIFLFIFAFQNAWSQELNCRVDVITPKLQQTDPRVFTTLKQSIQEFMNNRKWTNYKMKNEERIECTILITIIEERGNDVFKANLTLQSSRPVFNASLNTVMLNWNDKDFVFSYREFEPIEYNETQFTTNLAAVLSFYAYTIVGYDFDSFSARGGNPYHLKAKQILDMIPSSLGDQSAGWMPFQSTRNRYWLNENLLNPRLQNFRTVLYDYHFKGMDKMQQDKLAARNAIMNAIKLLDKTNNETPNTMFLQVFMNAKSQEIINVLSDAPQQNKTEMIEILNRIDPQNADKYFNMMKRTGQGLNDLNNIKSNN